MGLPNQQSFTNGHKSKDQAPITNQDLFTTSGGQSAENSGFSNESAFSDAMPMESTKHQSGLMHPVKKTEEELHKVTHLGHRKF